MWAKLNSDKDTIEEIIAHPKTMTVDGITHPRTLFSLWTDAERKAIGIVPVTTSGTSLDSKYYIEQNESFAIAGDKNSVVRTIGVKVADKNLADVNEVWTQDEIDDGQAPGGTSANDPKLDADGNQIITRGLKYQAIQKVKEQQAGYLSQTDWYIIRKADVGTAIPSNIQTWRNAIRADATEIETAITNAADMDEFIALHTDTYKTVDGQQVIDVVARVNRWTELGS